MIRTTIRNPLSHGGNVGKGEAFVTLVGVIRDPRVVEPRDEHDRPQNRKENP